VTRANRVGLLDRTAWTPTGELRVAEDLRRPVDGVTHSSNFQLEELEAERAKAASIVTRENMPRLRKPRARKLLIAKMKRERFGQSAERGRKLFDQLQRQELESLRCGRVIGQIGTGISTEYPRRTLLIENQPDSSRLDRCSHCRDVVRDRALSSSACSSTVLALIERAALDPQADAEKLERMVAMYRRLT